MNYQLKLKKKSKVSSKEDIAKLVGSKGVQVVYNLSVLGPRIILRSAIRLLRVNWMTRILSATFLIFFDILSLYKGHISFKQFSINAGSALSLLVGGTLGWYAGINAMEALIESTSLAIIGGLLGAGLLSAHLGKLWERGITSLIKDDATEMLHLLNAEFNQLIKKHRLNQQAADRLVEEITVNRKQLQQIYASECRESESRKLLEGYFKKSIK